MTQKIFANNATHFFSHTKRLKIAIPSMEPVENCSSRLLASERKMMTTALTQIMSFFSFIRARYLSMTLFLRESIIKKLKRNKKLKSLTNYLLVISLNLYLVLIVFSGLLTGRDAVAIRGKRERKQTH